MGVSMALIALQKVFLLAWLGGLETCLAPSTVPEVGVAHRDVP